jgi:hypothetical protein
MQFSEAVEGRKDQWWSEARQEVRRVARFITNSRNSSNEMRFREDSDFLGTSLRFASSIS